MLNFDFLEKSLGIVSPQHFVYNLSRIMSFMFCSINWPNFIFWLHLAICALQLLVSKVGASEILKLILYFSSSSFSTLSKSQDKYLNILRTKSDFEVKQKALFIILKGLSVAKNCLRPDSEPSSLAF